MSLAQGKTPVIDHHFRNFCHLLKAAHELFANGNPSASAESVLKVDYPNFGVLIVDDASTAPLSQRKGRL